MFRFAEQIFLQYFIILGILSFFLFTSLFRRILCGRNCVVLLIPSEKLNEVTGVQGQFEFGPDRLIVPALVMQIPADPILCKLDFNFAGAARLFTVPGLSQAYSTNPLVQFSVRFNGLNICHKSQNLHGCYPYIVQIKSTVMSISNLCVDDQCYISFKGSEL